MLSKRLAIGLVALFALTLLITACQSSPAAAPTQAPQPPAQATSAPSVSGPTKAPEASSNPTQIKVGWVAAIDQIGLAIAVDQGFFDKQGLDVKLAGPYPTGVDALNALQAGDIQFAQVGVPAIGAILKGMDLVFVGNYTGSSVQKGIDETMAMVANQDTGIKADDLATLKGKKIGASVGSISQLYLLGVLKKAGLAPTDVQIVNTQPADMPVALKTKGVDAMVTWDPFPVTALNDVQGSYQVMRGGGYISFIGYQTALRSYVQANNDTVIKYLTARVAADQWIRQNPAKAADIATRYLSGMKADVAKTSIEHDIKQLDPRFSACNYLAFDTDQKLLLDIGATKGTIDVTKTFQPGPILTVMSKSPELFSDLAPVPDAAKVSADYKYDATQAASACK